MTIEIIRYEHLLPSNIEISPHAYWKKLNYYDALLYCEMLVIDNKNDWRMPIENKETGGLYSWKIGDNIKQSSPTFNNITFRIIPVRDI